MNDFTCMKYQLLFKRYTGSLVVLSDRHTNIYSSNISLRHSDYLYRYDIVINSILYAVANNRYVYVFQSLLTKN